MSPSTDWELWTPGDFELAEGVRWVGDRLLFVDILTGRLLETSSKAPSAARVIAQVDVPLGAVAPCFGTEDEWVVAAGTGIGLLSRAGDLRWIGRPEDAADPPARMNDGTCDPFGRFWAGSMAYNTAAGAGSLYRVDTDLRVTRVLDEMTIVNGPAFNADGSLMYVTDSAAGRIHRCRLDPDTGEVIESQLFAQVEPGTGSPDGMTVDDEGRVWVAVWDGSAVLCYRPDGSLDQRLETPAPRPTSVCIAEGRLFVTTARYGLEHPTSYSGAVLSRPVAASAPQASPFGVT